MLKLLLKEPIAATNTALSFAELKSKAACLSGQSTPEEVGALLNALAKAGLSPVARDKIIEAIHCHAKVRRSALREQLSAAEQGLGQNVHDKAHQLAERTLNLRFGGGAHLKCGSDGFYAYNGRFWVPISGEKLGNVLLGVAKQVFPSARNLMALVGNAKRLLANMLAADDDFLSFANDPLPIVNCLNGELWIDTKGKAELKPHQPESNLTSCLPIAYDALASCPGYDAAFAGIFSKAEAPAEVVRHVHETIGYAIQPCRDIPCFFMLIGNGSNGKSKVLQTIQRLVGSTAAMNGRVTSFQRDAFGISALVGKKVFFDDDMPVDTVLDDGLIKMISEAKQMTTRHAHGRRHFTFRCLALPMMAGNDYPMTADSSYGMTRRAMVIPFARKFGEGEADPELFEKIWATELPGILNRALEGLARLRQRGGFALPVDCKRAANEFMANANPLAGFIDDQCEKDPKGSIPLPEFRDAMAAWVLDQGLKTQVPFKTLKRRLLRMNYEVTKVHGTERVKGLRLKSLSTTAA